MSDLSINNDAWLSKLRSHLDAESYTAGTVSQYMGVARRFVADLNKHSVAITATRPEDIDDTFNRRHGCILSATRIRRITGTGGLRHSTCFCAWSRATGRQPRLRSRPP